MPGQVDPGADIWTDIASVDAMLVLAAGLGYALFLVVAWSIYSRILLALAGHGKPLRMALGIVAWLAMIVIAVGPLFYGIAMFRAWLTGPGSIALFVLAYAAMHVPALVYWRRTWRRRLQSAGYFL